VILELCSTSSRFGMQKEFYDQITKYVFLYFEPFVAKMAFLMLKKLRIHYINSEFFFQNRPIKVSKDSYFYADFKNLNLPL
jgi:hypothetical protein